MPVLQRTNGDVVWSKPRNQSNCQNQLNQSNHVGGDLAT